MHSKKTLLVMKRNDPIPDHLKENAMLNINNVADMATAISGSPLPLKPRPMPIKSIQKMHLPFK